MSATPHCCQNPAELRNVRSPFSRIIALGFYDGPTSGVLQCETCQTAYRFDLLDWNDDHDVRVFRLAALPPQAFAECVQVLAQAGPPRWPVWVPRRGPEETAAAVDGALEPVLAQARPAELLVAWAGYGETIFAARCVEAAVLRDVPEWFALETPQQQRDWFAFLGLARNLRRGPLPAGLGP